MTTLISDRLPRLRAMRLIVARCEVRYSGRLNALLPEALRLIIVKADGSVLVHADAGGDKTLDWRTPPAAVEEEAGRMDVGEHARKNEDEDEIAIGQGVFRLTHGIRSAAEED